MTEDDPRDIVLRHRLADELAKGGALRSPQWRRAVERVPRHVFVPGFFRSFDTPDRGTLWEPVRDRFLDLSYRDETWVTQLDGRVTPQDVSEPVAGSPTSSSTLPSLVARMLEYLEVDDGMSVLEIGTGTGYSTALMCERLGDGRVTSIEVDPEVAARAADALRRTGHRPRLVIGDGLDGDPGRAPYDRIIATCSVRVIPRAWLTQTRPGGRILVPMTGWLDGHGLALLTVGGDGRAEGRFLPGTISFMIARPQAAPAVGGPSWNAAITALADADPRPTQVGPDVQADWTGAFLMQLAMPTAQHVRMRIDGGPWADCFVDMTTGSIASLTAEPGGWIVRQAGPTRLWDRVEETLDRWRRAGAPGLEHFGVRTDGRLQTIWLDTDEGPVSWSQTIGEEKTPRRSEPPRPAGRDEVPT